MERAFILAQRLHDPVRLIQAHALLGVNLYFLGELVPARAHLDQALTLRGSQPDCALRFAGQGPSGLLIPLAYVAFTLWMLGYPEQALTRIHESLLDEALALMDKHGDYRTAVGMYLIQGELLLRQAAPDAPRAAACFQQALAVAQRQQAKSYELRAAMSLARLWQQQGKRGEARALLVPIYGWFTEGFDTADLQDAQALLDE
jgi:tetratricopeptide (TPR) repeat protein